MLPVRGIAWTLVILVVGWSIITYQAGGPQPDSHVGKFIALFK